jgi:hypothetical protein
MLTETEQRDRRIKLTVVVLVLTAAAFYGGFILLTALTS